MIIGADDIAEGGKPLFYSLNLDFIRDCVTKMLEFLVCGRGWDEEAFTIADSMSDVSQKMKGAELVPSCQCAYDPCARYCGATYWHNVL